MMDACDNIEENLNIRDKNLGNYSIIPNLPNNQEGHDELPKANKKPITEVTTAALNKLGQLVSGNNSEILNTL